MADTRVTITATDRTARAFSSARTGLKKFGGDLREVRNLARGLIALEAVQAVVRLGTASFRAADQLATLSKQTKISVEDLSRLKFFADQNETSIESLTGALRVLGRQQLEAAKGSKQQVAIFEALGIAVKDSEGNLRPSIDVLRDLADVFAQLPDGATKTALAAKLLGRSFGPELVAPLSQGSKAIEAAFKEADRLGVTVKEETATAVDDLGDAFSKLGSQLAGRTGAMFLPLTLAATDLTNALSELIAQGNEANKTFAGGGGRFRGAGASGSFGAPRGRTNAGRPSLPDAPKLSEAEILEALAEGSKGKGSTKKAAAAENPVDRLIAAAREEAETFGQSARQIALYQAALDKATAAQLAQINAAYDIIEAKEAQKTADENAQDALKAAADAAEEAARTSTEFAKAQGDQAEAIRDALDPMRPYVRELHSMIELQRAGKISADEFNAAAGQLGERMKKTAEDAADAGDEINQFAIQAARSIQSAIADFLIDPFEDGLDGLIDRVQQTLNQIAAEIVAAELGRKLFGDLGGSGGGDLGGIVGDLLPKLFGAFGFAHEGGIIGPGLPRMLANVMAFADAPRYHSGGVLGLGPDEIPMIGKLGEEVLTTDDPRHRFNGGGSPINVTINAQDVESFRRSRGQLEAELRRTVDRGQRNL